MKLHSFRFMTVLLPFALTACMSPGPAAAAGPSDPSGSLGIDLGSSSSGRSPETGDTAQAVEAGEGHQRSTPASGQYQIAHAGHDDAHATGTVNSVDPAQHKLNISHKAIPEIGWPAMTMDFPVATSVDLGAVKPGSQVNFTLEKGKDGMYQIQSIQPAGAQ
jgi:Cu/Ag efflux protein CusF